MSRILTIDLGTRMGYAFAVNRKLVISGTREDKPGRYSGGGMRFLRFRGWLQDFHNLQQIDRVYLEEVRRHLSTDSAHVYGGLLAHLTAWCEEQKIPYEGIPVGTIKKDATGKGNAGKVDVIVAMNKRWGRTMDTGEKSKDDNEADALAILHSALCHEPLERRIRPRLNLKD